MTYPTGISFTATATAGEREGAAKNIPQSITDGEHFVAPHEPPLLSHGKELNHNVKVAVIVACYRV